MQEAWQRPNYHLLKQTIFIPQNPTFFPSHHLNFNQKEIWQLSTLIPKKTLSLQKHIQWKNSSHKCLSNIQRHHNLILVLVFGYCFCSRSSEWIHFHEHDFEVLFGVALRVVLGWAVKQLQSVTSKRIQSKGWGKLHRKYISFWNFTVCF